MYDNIVIGSGFGGALSALRLAEKGFRVAILEPGKNYRANDLSRTTPDFSKYFWIFIFTPDG